jgi:hypothetical protein
MYRKLSLMDETSRPPVSEDTPAGPVNGHRTPRWVKVGWVMAVVLVVAFAALHLAGGGFRHHHFPNGATTQTKQSR